jgi:hypothetical protein
MSQAIICEREQKYRSEAARLCQDANKFRGREGAKFRDADGTLARRSKNTSRAQPAAVPALGVLIVKHIQPTGLQFALYPELIRIFHQRQCP